MFSTIKYIEAYPEPDLEAPEALCWRDAVMLGDFQTKDQLSTGYTQTSLTLNFNSSKTTLLEQSLNPVSHP